MALTRPPGTWVYEDLFALPEDGTRYEIIEGDLYVLPRVGSVHATVVMNLILELLPFVRSLGGQLVTAPLDVFFPRADPVQPDILAILPGSRAIGGGRGVEGPPDLVIEVVSPGHRVHDLLTKRALYGLVGVREYWVVDPADRTVEILTLDRDALRTLQTASGEDIVISPLLGGFTLPLATIFARLDDIED